MTVSMLATTVGLGDWGWLLVDLGWKSLAVLLAIVGVDRFCLRRRPLAADAVWFTTLLVLMLLPLFSLLAPVTLGWQITILHRQPVVAARSVPTDATYRRLPAHDKPLDARQPESGAAASEANESDRSGSLFGNPIDGARASALLVYLGVAMLLAARLAGGCLLATRLARRSERLDSEPWTSRLAIHRRKLAIGRKVSLGLSSKVLAPHSEPKPNQSASTGRS